MNEGAKNYISAETAKDANASARPSRRIVQESGSAFQISPGNAPGQADGVS
jgi:hypothetical protein